jgi:protein-S-isoprenylcysteine O-methyltransferase Ste14
MEQTMEHASVKINPFVIYIGIGLLAALLQHFIPLPFLPSLAARFIGVAFLVINLFFGLPALKKMFAARTSPNPNRPTTALVSSGPYRFTRNPMYIGLTLVFMGLLTYLQITWGLILLPLLVWLITVWVIRPEEQYLEWKFGGEYAEYKKHVRRWI